MGLFCWAPLAEGYLSGKYSEGVTSVPDNCRLRVESEQLARYDSPRGRAIVGSLQKAANALNATPAQVALAWIISKPHVTCAITGVRSLAQLYENVAALHMQLPGDVIEQLDRVCLRPLEYPYSYLQREFGRWS